MHKYPTIDKLKERLQQPLPGLNAQERMAARVLPLPLKIPDSARLSAVLCLLYPIENTLHILLMKRKEDGSAHSGQVSFPGGRHEEYDTSLEATALREATEEVGIPTTQVDILGSLTPLYIPVSNFQVYPFVAYVNQRPEFILSENEVAYIMEVPIHSLFEEATKTVTDVISPAMPDVIRKVKAYQLQDGTIIWGATAMILSELEVVMDGILND